MTICKDIEQLVEKNLDKILSLRSRETLKPEGSYVTEGDLLVQELISNLLKQKYPDVHLISEEQSLPANLDYTKANVLVLDPIDGTENFRSGLSHWGVSVCYFEQGKQRHSLLMLPELKKSLTNGQIFTRFRSRIQGLSSSLKKEDLLALAESPEYRIIGCCVFNMYSVITGSYRSFENPKGAYVWDILAGLCLAKEFGLNVEVEGKAYEGQFLLPDRRYRFKVWHE